MPARSRKLHQVLNAIWRELAAPHRDRITVIELADMLGDADKVHNHHYRPAALQRMAGVIDDWYDERQHGREPRTRLAA